MYSASTGQETESYVSEYSVCWEVPVGWIIGVFAVCLLFIVLLVSSGLRDRTQSLLLPVARPVFVKSALTSVLEKGSSLMGFLTDQEGNVIVVRIYDVLLFKKGDPTHHETLVDGSIYRKQIKERMQSFASGIVGPDGTLWLGTWQGQLVRRKPNGRLDLIHSDKTTGKISSLILYENLVIGATSKGILIHDPGTGITSFDPTWPGRVVTDIKGGSAGQVFAVSGRTFYTGIPGSQWDSVARCSDGTGWEKIFVTPRGGVYLGSRKALYKYSGVDLEPVISGFVPSAVGFLPDGGLVLGSVNSGLFLQDDDGNWKTLRKSDGLNRDSFTGIVVREGKIWLGYYGRVLEMIDVTDARELGRPYREK